MCIGCYLCNCQVEDEEKGWWCVGIKKLKSCNEIVFCISNVHFYTKVWSPTFVWNLIGGKFPWNISKKGNTIVGDSSTINASGT